MKWKNKGHEFDELGERLQKYDAIYLFGAGAHGKTVYEKYQCKIHIKGFIDNDREKQGQSFCGLPILAVNNIKLLSNEAIVITTQPQYLASIEEQLRNYGFRDIYSMQVFFPIFDVYKFGEICLSSVSFLPTTVCNLKCKYCLNFSPYIKKHQIRPLKQLKCDLDLLFSKIDTLLLLHISGGEPFTYPYLPELIDYVSQNYKNKLGRLEMTTNGTVVPDEKLLVSMYNAGLYLTVDDYRDVIPSSCDKQNEILALLNKFGVSYRILKTNSWIDLAPFNRLCHELSDSELLKHFDCCAVPWQEYRDGKLWICNYAAYADIADIVPTRPEEYFNLEKFTTNNCRELVEFRLGFSDKGYTEFCKICQGFTNNPNTVSVAEQL